MMGAIFPIRSSSFKSPRKVGNAICAADEIDDVALPLVQRSEPSLAGLRVGWSKLGRFVAKCLSDGAMDSTMMWF
jgi:hypothetical protein